MIIPLLDYLQEKKLYSEEELLIAKLDLVKKTKMVDLAAEEYKKLNKTDVVPPEMETQNEVYNELKRSQVQCGKLLDILGDDEEVEELRKNKSFNMEYLQDEYGITDANLDALYRYAKLNFDCGRYIPTAEQLNYFRMLSKDEEKNFWALWGKLAAEILTGDWEVAYADLKLLKESIDQRHTRNMEQARQLQKNRNNRPGRDNHRESRDGWEDGVFSSHSRNFLEQLQHRSWLIHWSMFIFFNLPNGRHLMIDFLWQEAKGPGADRLLNTVQVVCPHILRYLTCAVIINKRKKNVLKDIVRVIIQEKDTYSDPITEFLRVLYVEFDFENAHKKLAECEKLLGSDFFLVSVADELMEQARQLIFETYARVHHCIDIRLLGARMELKEGESEEKIIELIRSGRVDVKFDGKLNQIVMDTKTPSVYQQVLEKTESLNTKTTHLLQEFEKKFQLKQEQVAD